MNDQRAVNRRQFAAMMNSRGLLLLAANCLLLTSALLGCKNTPPPTPLDQLTPQQSLGHQYFQTHCAQCHYDRQPGPLHGPSLLSLYKKPYLPSGAPANDDRVTATILHGHGMMPASPETDSTDLQNLLAYLHTL